MAVAANGVEPFTGFSTIVTALVKPSAFTVTPSAGGFLTEVDADLILPPAGLSGPKVLVGVLTPGGDFLEGTMGQIWPI